MITPTRLTEYVRGSGAFGYAPWWTAEQPDGHGGLIIEFTDPEPEPDTPAKVEVFRLSPGKLRNTFLALTRNNHPCFRGVDTDDPDIDAEMGDVILQEAAFGEVIYG